MTFQLPGCSANPDDPPKLRTLGEAIEVKQVELKEMRRELRQVDQSLDRRDPASDLLPFLRLQLKLARLEEKLVPMLLEHEHASHLLKHQRYEKAQQHLREVEADRREQLGIEPDGLLTVIQKQSDPKWIKAYRASVGFPLQSTMNEIHQCADYLKQEIPGFEQAIKWEQNRQAELKEPPQPLQRDEKQVQRLQRERLAADQNAARKRRSEALLR